MRDLSIQTLTVTLSPRLQETMFDLGKIVVEKDETKPEFQKQPEQDFDKVDVAEVDYEKMDVAESDFEKMDVAEADYEKMDVVEPDYEKIELAEDVKRSENTKGQDLAK